MAVNHAISASPRQAYRALAGNVSYRTAIVAHLCTMLADSFQMLAIAALVLDLTQSVSSWGTVLLAGGLSEALLMLFTGVLVDRYGPHRIMLGATLLGAVVSVAFLLVLLLGTPAIWQLYLLSVAGAVMGSLYGPASSTIVPLLVPPESLRTANSLWFGTYRTATIVGPPLAGLLLGLIGSAPVFAMIAGITLLAAAALWRISAPEQPARMRGTVWQETAEGLRAVRSIAVIRMVLLLGIAGAFVYAGILTAALPPLAKLTFQAGNQGIGWLMGALGVGGVVGTLLVGTLPVRRPGLVVAITRLAGGALILLIGLAPFLAGAAALLVVVGLVNALSTVVMWTLVQTYTPAEVRGRVMGITTFVLTGVQPLAFGLAGLAGDGMGPRQLLVFGGLVLMASGVLAMASRLFRTLSGN